MIYLKQSTAKTLRFGPFLDETDGKTAETALTVSQADIRLSKNGAAFAQTNGAGGATHDEAGWYSLELDATDTATLGPLMVAIHESGALPVWREFLVVPANVYDSLVAGSDLLQVDVEQVDGGATAAANLKTAGDNYSATRGLAGTALPAAAANAAGGLPISAGGSLALDTQLANTHEITAARMGALTDWIDGGRLDLILDTVNAAVAAAAIRTALGLAAANLDTQLAAVALEATLTAIKGAGWTDENLTTIDALIDALTTAVAGVPTTAEFEARTILAAAYGTAANQATIAGYLDTEIAAILAAVDTEVAAIKAVTDALPDAGALTTIGTDTARLTAARAQVLTDWIDAGRLDLLIDAIKAKTDNLPASPAATGAAMTLTSGERDSIAAALLDLANGIETGYTPRQVLRIIAAACAGKLSGAATATVTMRDLTDAVDRIVATCDADGNRTAVTLDGA